MFRTVVWKLLINTRTIKNYILFNVEKYFITTIVSFDNYGGRGETLEVSRETVAL